MRICKKMSESAGKGFIFIFGLFSKCLRVKPEEGECELSNRMFRGAFKYLPSVARAWTSLH